MSNKYMERCFTSFVTGLSIIRVAVHPQNEIMFSWLHSLSIRITKYGKPGEALCLAVKIFTTFLSLHVVKRMEIIGMSWNVSVGF